MRSGRRCQDTTEHGGYEYQVMTQGLIAGAAVLSSSGIGLCMCLCLTLRLSLQDSLGEIHSTYRTDTEYRLRSHATTLAVSPPSSGT
jgi:hypothetical protein